MSITEHLDRGGYVITDAIGISDVSKYTEGAVKRRLMMSLYEDAHELLASDQPVVLRFERLLEGDQAKYTLHVSRLALEPAIS